MMLPLLWIICGIWFYRSAQKVNSRPWPWVVVLVGASTLFYLLLAVASAFYLDSIQPHYATPGHFTDAEFAAFKHYDSFGRVLMIASFIADVGFVVALRSAMIKKAPFQSPDNARLRSAPEPVYAPASKTTCDQCGSSFPSGLYLEKSEDSRYLCEKCRVGLAV